MKTSSDTFACHMFCRGCGYALIGLPGHRCPECGRDFDPANPRTFLAHPRRSIMALIPKIAVVFVGLTLATACSYFGNLAWQAHQESKAVQFLEANLGP